MLNDAAFLLTYSRMPEDALRGDLVALSLSSVQEISSAKSRAIIAVSYRKTVLWSIPVDECQTWLVSFIYQRLTEDGLNRCDTYDYPGFPFAFSGILA